MTQLKKPLDILCGQLLASWTDPPTHSLHTNVDEPESATLPIAQPSPTAISDYTEDRSLFNRQSGYHTHAHISAALMSQQQGGASSCRQLIAVRLPHHTAGFSSLSYKNIYCVDTVYGKSHRRDGLCFRNHNGERYGLM